MPVVSAIAVGIICCLVPRVAHACWTDLSRIIERHDECAHAHFFRGQLFKRIGRHERAASDFRSTLEHDPKRMDALAELRLYVSRRRRGA
jgi:lipoprotein NlpI